jgi:hypothetical protein
MNFNILIFMLLDEPPPPPLFADRVYFRSLGNAAHDGGVLANQASGQHDQQFREHEGDSSETHFSNRTICSQARHGKIVPNY